MILRKKTYQITVIVGNLILLRNKKAIVVIYKSTEKTWEMRRTCFEERMSEQKIMSSFPSIFTQKQKIFWFCKSGARVCICDLNGDGEISFHNILMGIKDITEQTLGIVMYKGRTIMVCKGKTPYTHALNFYEFAELDGDHKLKQLFTGMWRSKYAEIT